MREGYPNSCALSRLQILSMFTSKSFSQDLFRSIDLQCAFRYVVAWSLFRSLIFFFIVLSV